MSFPRKTAYILAGIAAISLIIYFFKQLGVPVEAGFIRDVLIGGTAIPLAILLFQKSSEQHDREKEFLQQLNLKITSINTKIAELEKNLEEFQGLALRIEAQKELIIERVRELEKREIR